MTEFSCGFITSIIERSEKILIDERYDVTRLLLLLSFGFGMVFERLKFQDAPLEASIPHHVLHRKFEDKLGNSFCDRSLSLNNGAYFEHFCKSDEWEFRRVRYHKRRYDIKDLLEPINSGEKVEKLDLKYSELMRCLRNSLAHGGIHPLSPRQSCRLHVLPPFSFKKLGTGSNENIDKVIFVSKWKEKDEDTSKEITMGFNTIIFSVEALHLFWKDWRNLLYKNNYSELDNAA